MDINAFSVFHLSKLCNKLNIELVQISTHAVFDGTSKKPYLEKDKTNPINIYGYAKLVGEYFVQMNLKKYYILRMPTMYGPRKNKSLGFVDKMLNNMKQGKNLKIAGDRIDSPSYALTISKKIKKLIDDKKYGIHHISDKGVVSYYEFIKELSKLIGFRGKIQKVKDNLFPSAAPNPLRVAISSKNGTGVFWKNALKEYVKKENIKC